ncbi:unnamed protein product [Rotaria socialis]|uniref:Uncharacterized protein n=1 Tax=Rotaria socialis TaxID=392032 RepID=A0A818JKN1_9BILA|nr:unnamed protein product [Rotaria socialis]CAF4760269.1 unnamed protein product [Rotaria socialis]
MTTRTTDGDRLDRRQLAKKSTNTARSINYINNPPPPPPPNKQPRSPSPPPQSRPPPSLSKSSALSSTQKLVSRAEITPKARLVVVRASSRSQNEESEGETGQTFETPESVQIPAVYTNGRTSVYVIRRPIPPPEPPRETKLYQPDDDGPPKTTKKKQNTGSRSGRRRRRRGEGGGGSDHDNSLRQINTSSPADDVVSSPSQVHSSFISPKASERRSSFTRNESRQPDSPVIDSSEPPKIHISSPTQVKNFETIENQSTPKSVVAIEVYPNNKDPRARSRSRRRRRRRTSSKQRPSSRSSVTDQEEPKNTNEGKSFFPFLRTKSTAIQVDLIPGKIVSNQQRKGKRKTTPNQRLKSSKSIVLLNPDDQTIAVVENSYVKGNSMSPVIQGTVSSKKNRFLQGNTQQSKENSHKGSRCLDCLSRRMCLLITICLILAVIGLAGAGVSAYFLATDFQTDSIPKIIGAAAGGVLAIASMCFLYCVLACIGSRDGYFSYHGDGPQPGGRAFAVIASTHQNAHFYTPANYRELHKTNPTTSSNSFTARSVTQLRSTNRQNTIVSETNSAATGKNITIEMPERLLTARKDSPKTRERKMNNVVSNIGRVVEDAKKRYHGDVPTKVIVTVDEKANTKF